MTSYKFNIGIYELRQCYGGAEEGGWYYEDGEKIKEINKSFLLPELAEKYADRLYECLHHKPQLILKRENKYHTTQAETDEDICRGESFGNAKYDIKISQEPLNDYWLTERPYYS